MLTLELFIWLFSFIEIGKLSTHKLAHNLRFDSEITCKNFLHCCEFSHTVIKGIAQYFLSKIIGLELTSTDTMGNFEFCLIDQCEIIQWFTGPSHQLDYCCPECHEISVTHNVSLYILMIHISPQRYSVSIF